MIGRVLVLAGVVASAGCASSLAEGPDSETDLVERDRGSLETGRATYYADRFAGRRTANGERYDPQALTAAHRTLPLGTLVEVARPDGRSVRVRINDRGPFGDERRIVDLSRRAAEDLGIMKMGVADITLRVLAMPAKSKRSRHP